MCKNIFMQASDLTHWVPLNQFPESESIQAYCNVSLIQNYLDRHVKIRHLKVASAEINTSGCFRAPKLCGDLIPPVQYHDLPPFCDIRILHETGDTTEEITVWIPFRWNHRFLGLFGACNRTVMWLDEFSEQMIRSAVLPTGLRNGFATACTDGGNRETDFLDWGYAKDTGIFRSAMYYNWADYSTHVMTVVGKAVTEAVGGHPPLYSYGFGGSGGGRQSLAECEKYPEDYDGLWADCPGIEFHKLQMTTAWPAVVMNTLKNPLAPEKFEAFRAAVWKKAGGRDAYYRTTNRIDLDAFSLVGTRTEAGAITETDALVMQKIWEGPRTEDGRFLWFGYRPGCDCWHMGGAAYVEKDGSRLIAHPHMTGQYHILGWLLKDPKRDFASITIKEFVDLFLQGIDEYPRMDFTNPDLRNFADAGGKIILCHGTDDDAIPVESTIRYYRKIVELFGDLEEVKSFARLFVIPGDGHGVFNKNGHGPSKATAMIALMNWVENGIAPESIPGQRVKPETAEILEYGSNPIYC